MQTVYVDAPGTIIPQVVNVLPGVQGGGKHYHILPLVRDERMPASLIVTFP